MASFKALNIESDDDTDDEIDNTKEIQIEEALKNYQTALKYHSEGPRFLKDAGEAYKSLFESEIFKYPESQSDYNRSEAQGDYQDQSVLLVTDAEETIIATDSAPSTLPRILHLSYKNRGEFHLLELQEALSNKADAGNIIRSGTSKALADFAEALDKDEADLDLWRRAARVGRARGSERISRYCLEAVLEGDEEGADDVLGIPGVEVNFANQELKKFQVAVQDDLSLQQSSFKEDTSGLTSIWRKQLILYPFLPEHHSLSTPREAHDTSSSNRTHILLEDDSWCAIGAALLERLRAEQRGDLENATGISLDIKSLKLSEPIPNGTTTGLQLREEAQQFQADEGTEVRAENESDIKEEHLVRADETIRIATKSEEEQQHIHDRDLGELDTKSPINKAATTTARKRSAEAAELPENAEEGRVRSKRIRARQSIALEAAQAETNAADPTIAFDEKIWENIAADNLIFERLNSTTGKLGVEMTYNPQDMRNLIRPEPAYSKKNAQPLYPAIKDFYDTMQSWSSDKTKLLSQVEVKHDNSIEARMSGLASFLENISKSTNPAGELPTSRGVAQFIKFVNNQWLSPAEVALLWMESLISTTADFLPSPKGQSAYRCYLWPKHLKDTLVSIALVIDDLLKYCVKNSIFELSTKNFERISTSVFALRAQVEVAQTLFEIHLEHLAQIVGPFSSIDEATRESQKIRLDGWLVTARDGINLLDIQPPYSEGDDLLALRHCWAVVLFLQHSGDISREHLITCINDLRNTFSVTTGLEFSLPNNSLMPELSVAAADRELSKIETMDFFLNIFHKDQTSPVDLIEALEPILEATLGSERTKAENTAYSTSLSVTNGDKDPSRDVTPDIRTSTTTVLRDFLKRAHSSLRLSLWKRLQDAYESIDYPPKVLSILLRITGLLIDELKTTEFQEMPLSERQAFLLTSLREIGYSLKAIINITNNKPDIFEFFDMSQLRSSIHIACDLFCLLYSISLFDDYSQIGNKGGSNMNPFRYYPLEVFHSASVKFHDMQAQTCLLIYKLLIEGMNQVPAEFQDVFHQKVFLLRDLHSFLGVRKVCKAADSLLLRFMMDELLGLPNLETETSNDLAQVLYDMYDMNCFLSAADRQDHKCDADYLDRRTAFKLIEFVFGKAQEATIKDLLKSDIGKSVEKLNTALGTIKSPPAAARNRKILNAYLRAPLSPLDIWRSMKGIGAVSIIAVNPEEAPVAHTGWYFLRAQVAMAKHKALRSKGTVQETDDVESAIALFMQDLECRADRWETLTCLAEANDNLIEQHVLWSADRLNASKDSLSVNQCIAIHAYMLAMAAAQRDAPVQETTIQKLAELNANFGMRLYSSCRPPFSMHTFCMDEVPRRHYSSSDALVGPYSDPPFRGLSEVEALRTASSLFQRATRLKGDSWINHYMLAKCLWKILQLSRVHEKWAEVPQNGRRNVVKVIFDVLNQSIRYLPERKDSNRQDPILEPIYKVTVVAHKLVEDNMIEAELGANYIESAMQKQNQFDASKMPTFAAAKDWTSYMIDMLKFVRSADKSRWHHRLVYRVAKIIRDRGVKEDNIAEAAKEAKEYLLDQHLYSAKTSALTVWKPDNERAGRHWVYMSRYAKFLTEIFNDTKDIESIQLLARRVRKKTTEFFEHTDVWHFICEMHTKMHREYAQIEADGYEGIFGKIDQEEFHLKANVIDAWISSKGASDRLVEVLREATELKKLDQGLWKGISLDNLIVDTYSQIWRVIGPTLDMPALPSRAATPIPVGPPPRPPTPPSADKRGIMSLNNMIIIKDSSNATPVGKESLQPLATVSTTTSTLHAPSGDLAIRPRSRLISRREVLKRASDSVTTRPQPKRGSPAPELVVNPLPSSVVRVVIEARDEDVNSSVGIEGTSTAMSSAPGSVMHDGNEADDESELSAIEDTEKRFEETFNSASEKVLFPNLQRGISSSPLSETPLEFEDDETMIDADVDEAEKDGGIDAIGETNEINGNANADEEAHEDNGGIDSGEEQFADAQEEML